MFEQLAKSVNQKTLIDTNEELANLKNQKASYNDAMDIAAKELEMKRNQQEAVKSDIKFQEQRAKLNADLMKQMIDQSTKSPVAVGDQMLPQMGAAGQDEETRELPFIDMQSKVL